VPHRRPLAVLPGAVFVVALLAGCGTPPDAVPPLTIGPASSVPTAPLPTPQPPLKTLIVCTAYEPKSLYWYGASGPSAEAVLAALYDGPVDLVEFAYQAPLLTKVPSTSDGDLRVEAVSVTTGEVFLDPLTLAARNLTYGDSYLPSGCTGLDCVRVFQGGQVTMDRMVAEFHLKAAQFWSDGEPLTASDSAFSFEVDAHPDTATTKYLVDRTAAYEVPDDLTVRWTGIPGFMDPGAAGNFWSPLPEHALEGIPIGDLPAAEAAARAPLSFGPYALESWTPGQELVLTRNPFYGRAEEGLPAFERLAYRFIGPGLRQGLQQLLTGECDVLDESVTLSPADGEDYRDSLSQLIDLEAQGEVRMATTPGSLVEQMTFNVRQGQQSNPLSASGVRQAVAMCLDVQAVADAAWRGLAGVTRSYLPPAHPLADDDPAPPSTDRAGAQALLQQSGWVAPGSDLSAPRVASGAAGAIAGAPLQFTLTIADTGVEAAAGLEIERQLSECGIDVILKEIPAESLGVPYPDGPVFGGDYQAVLWAWPAWRVPPCELFAASEIPSELVPNGANASGFNNPAYDRACAKVLLGGGGGTESAVAASETQAIVAEQLPTLPLFVWPRLLAFSPEMCGPQADPSIPSLLWTIETWDRGEACPVG
jgi:peptide/nickel transport system substrate-binding protein